MDTSSVVYTVKDVEASLGQDTEPKAVLFLCECVWIIIPFLTSVSQWRVWMGECDVKRKKAPWVVAQRHRLNTVHLPITLKKNMGNYMLHKQWRDEKHDIPLNPRTRIQQSKTACLVCVNLLFIVANHGKNTVCCSTAVNRRSTDAQFTEDKSCTRF